MSKTIRQQFEEVITFENSFGQPLIPSEIKEKLIMPKLESIADTQAIEFAKWIRTNVIISGDEDEYMFLKTGGFILESDLLSQFKSEHYK